MKNILALTLSIGLIHSPVSADLADVYDRSTISEEVIDWLNKAAEWAIKKYAKKQRASGEQVVSWSEYPDLSNFGKHEGWLPGYCAESRMYRNVPTWLNNSKKNIVSKQSNVEGPKGFKNINYKEYTVSNDTPVEFETQDQSSRGVKEFFNFYNSWVISSPLGEAILIENLKEGDDVATYTFDYTGDYWVNSNSTSDFQIGISISSDLDHISELGQYKLKGTWGGDVLPFNCDVYSVKVEKNTPPKINNVSFISYSSGRAAHFISQYQIEDTHTSSSNLIVNWTFYLNGKVLPQNAGKMLHPSYVPAEMRSSYKYRLVVSDGGLSTVKEGLVI